MRLFVEFVHTLDSHAWERRHSEGEVPNVLPYGLDRLREYGHELVIREAPRPRYDRWVGGVGRRVTGGYDVAQAFHDRRRRSCDLSFCWDERTGVPAALRSALPGEPPVAMGTLWMTDPTDRHSPLARLLANRAARRATLIWANSQAQLDQLERLGVPGSRLHLLPTPGIDVDFWTVDGDGDRRPGLVLAAGNDVHRDHPLLVRALTRAQAEEPSIRLDLVTKQQLAVPGTLGARTHYVSHTGLRSMYARASVVATALRPNLHISGSTVALEAMACRLPVVMTSNPGVDEYVQHGVTGYLVEPADERGFADAVVDLVRDSEKARAFGLAGRRLVEERLSSARIMERLAGILRNV